MAYKENKDYKRKPIRRDVTPEVAEGTVIGRNAVRELLKSGRDVDKIFVQRGEREGSITVLVAEALARKIPVVEAEKPKLSRWRHRRRTPRWTRFWTSPPRAGKSPLC